MHNKTVAKEILLQSGGFSLTGGFVKSCFTGNPAKESIVQVLDITTKGNYYFMPISDGEHTMFGLVPSNSSIITEYRILQSANGGPGLLKSSIIKLKDFSINVSGKVGNMLHIIELEVLVKESQLLGDPVPYEASSQNNNNNNNNKNNQNNNGLPTAGDQSVINNNQNNNHDNGNKNIFDVQNQPPQQVILNRNSQVLNRSLRPNSPIMKPSQKPINENEELGPDGIPIRPISYLNPFQQRWMIRARCVYKNPIRTFQKDTGEGKVASVELLDQSGEIKVIMFGESVDDYYNLFQVGSVYFLSKAKVKQSQGKFASQNNQFEITLNKGAHIQECTEEEGKNVPKETYKVVKIDQIANLAENDTVDIVAIVRDATELKTINAKNGGRPLKKRDLTVSDNTGSIILTIWNDQAEGWTINEFPIIIGMKNCRVKNFNGKCLGTGDGFRYELSPSTPAALELQEWYENQEAIDVFANLPFLSNSQGGGGQDTTMGNTPIMSLADGINLVKGKEGKAEFFGIRGTITLFKHDSSVNMTYDACPADKCLKKVTENPEGSYECVKCNRTYPNCLVRYVLNMVLADSSTSSFMSVFDDASSAIVGKEAGEIKRMRQEDSPELPGIMDGILHLEGLFKIKAYEELYNDEFRVKCAVLGAYPIDFASESAKIIAQINSYL